MVLNTLLRNRSLQALMWGGGAGVGEVNSSDCDVSSRDLLIHQEGDVLELYSEKEPVKPFLFYHNKSGTTSTFESAAFPGWFIAVCSKGSCPLFLTQELGKTHITDFEMIVVD